MTNPTRLEVLRAERAKLDEALLDLSCCMTLADLHYAEEDLAAWDRKHGDELARLEDDADTFGDVDGPAGFEPALENPFADYGAMSEPGE